MPKRLILMFDGTWNTPEDHTNVRRLYDLLSAHDAGGREQLRWYHKGVGTSWHGRLLGGIFGYGLSEIIRAGYAWLARHYAPDDEIFVFGFSRGAYSARSLVGLVRKCGILHESGPALVSAAYDLYRKRGDDPDGPAARAFREQYAREARVRFVGVWDTVGSLGIPNTGLQRLPFAREYYEFHDTKLSRIVDYAYQALAIDENRKDYAPCVWSETKPENREVEQRWFSGCHSNVGGGYKRDRVPYLALRWLQQKAGAVGMATKQPVEVRPDDALAPLRDSYREFLGGLYALGLGGPRLHRTIGKGCRESIDASVWLRWHDAQLDPRYRAQSLQDLKVDVEWLDATRPVVSVQPHAQAG